MKSWLDDNDKETYSIYNEEKLIITEKFNSTLTNKFKTMWLQYQKIKSIFVSQYSYINIYS